MEEQTTLRSVDWNRSPIAEFGTSSRPQPQVKIVEVYRYSAILQILQQPPPLSSIQTRTGKELDAEGQIHGDMDISRDPEALTTEDAASPVSFVEGNMVLIVIGSCLLAAVLLILVGSLVVSCRSRLQRQPEEEQQEDGEDGEDAADLTTDLHLHYNVRGQPLSQREQRVLSLFKKHGK